MNGLHRAEGHVIQCFQAFRLYGYQGEAVHGKTMRYICLVTYCSGDWKHW